MAEARTISGRWLLIGVAVASAIFAAVVVLVGWWVNLERVDARPDWRERDRWASFPVKPVHRPDEPRAPGEARPPRTVKLPPSITADVRQELERLAAVAGGASFDQRETEEVLRTSVERYPDLFYPRFLLASWLRMRGQASRADAAMAAAFARADAALTLRYVRPGGERMAGLRVGSLVLAYELREDRRATDRLVLVYPLAQTDKVGRVYVPVYQGVYEVEAWPAVEGSEAAYRAPPLFAFPPPVAALPDAVVEGTPRRALTPGPSPSQGRGE